MAQLGAPKYFYRDESEHEDISKATYFRSEVIGFKDDNLPKLRNFLIGGIVCWGAKEIRINENLSTLNDEIVADRLAMIPYGIADSDPSFTQSLYHLKVENIGDERLPVLSSMMTHVEGPVLKFPNVIVTYLLKGGNIDIYIVCDKGIGIENYRYGPVLSVTYPTIDGKQYIEVESVENVRPVDIYKAALKFMETF